MKTFDITCLTYHAEVDRETRINIIKKTVGFGNPCAEAPDKDDRDATAILTDTGVIVILNPYGLIVTTWIASVRQASAIYYSNHGKKMPKSLWAIVNYNNNTETWHKMAA